MHHRTVHRGIAALMLTAVLALAGATPAAAAELDFFARSLRWLSSLWGAGQEQESTARSGSGSGWLDGILSSLWEADSTDKGMGLDPNGEPTTTPEPPPSEDR